MIMNYPILTYVEGKNWKLVEDFVKDEYKVPSGFIYDLASIPQILWWFLPPFGRWLPATTIHDFNYRTENKLKRSEADFLMFKMLINDGVGITLSTLMYIAVRIFGKKRWEKTHTS